MRCPRFGGRKRTVCTLASERRGGGRERRRREAERSGEKQSGRWARLDAQRVEGGREGGWKRRLSAQAAIVIEGAKGGGVRGAGTSQ